MDFTLKQVETFRTVYETTSVSDAARRLGVSPASVSATLGTLEAALDLRLFDRTRQRLVRTPEADLLYEEVRRLNVGLSALSRKVAEIKGTAQPRLRLGSIHAYSGALIRDALPRFRQRYGQTPLYLQLRDSNILRDMVVAGELDMALVADESELDGVLGYCLARLKAVVVFPRGHPFGRRATLCAQDLANTELIVLNAHDASRRRLDAWLAEAGVSMHCAIETPYSNTICQLVAAGHGVGIANPASLTPQDAHELDYRVLEAPAHFECHMILNANRPLSAAGKHCASCLREAIAPLVARFGA